MCLTHPLSQRFDEAHANAFADRLINTLNEGALCLMLSIGHRTGLLDALAGLEAGSSVEIAAAANLDERYVRECLGALTTGGIVEYDALTQRYRLPPEHAAFLTRKATPDNIAVFAQYIPLLAQVEDRIVECFRSGGGVAYDQFPRFHAVMAEDSSQTVLSALSEHILPLVPGLQDQLRRGIQVLDVGCGRGHALLLLAERFPESDFVGFDLSGDAIEFARRQTAQRGLTNLEFEVRDVSDFDTSAPVARFDCVFTFDAIHDQADPRAVLKGIRRTLRPGGVYLMQDIHGSSHVENNLEHPIGPLLYTISTMHCTTVSLAQDGAGLGTMWGRELASEMLRDAGFGAIEVHQLEHDFQNDYYVIRP